MELLKRIPLNANRILHVGCGDGSLGGAFKLRNPASYIVGFETDPHVAALAMTQLDDVIVFDIENDYGTQIEARNFDRFDCIIQTNSTEVMDDPWSIIRIIHKLLSDSGILIFNFRNAENWRNVERLLRGAPDHNKQRGFAKRHRGGFSSEEARCALVASGLHPVDVTLSTNELLPSEAFMDLLSPILTDFGIDAEEYSRRSGPEYCTWIARRNPVKTIKIVSTMLNPVGGVSHVRVVEPMRALATDPALLTTIIGSGDLPPSDAGEPGIFIFHRPLLAGKDGLDRIRKLVVDGWLVICEFDDHPDYIPVLQRPDIYNFCAVHAIQTSTVPLAKVLRHHNPEVVVFPNSIFSLPQISNYQPNTPLTLLIAGLNREEEWPDLLGALNAVASHAGDRLNFHVVVDRGLFESLQTPHKKFTPLCDYDSYKNILAHSEISFMPLADTPFNRCKSDLKFIEAAAHRVTSLASKVVYSRSIEDKRTGLLFGDAAELHDSLWNLILHPDIARNIAETARSYIATSRMMAYQVEERSTWYRSLWARRKELQQKLDARVPELACR